MMLIKGNIKQIIYKTMSLQWQDKLDQNQF